MLYGIYVSCVTFFNCLLAFHYEVTTLTGDHWAGGTDSTVYITLKGTRGDSGKRILYTPQGKRRAFRQGQVSVKYRQNIFLCIPYMWKTHKCIFKM